MSTQRPHDEFPHDPTARELAELYAAGALTPGEVDAFEFRIRAGDAAFVNALQEVRPAMERLLNAADPVAPPAGVRASLIARLGADAPVRDDPDENPFVHDHPADEPEPAAAGAPAVAGVTILHAATARWKRTGLPGVRYRTLLADRKANRRTILLKMDPGAELPDHSHAGIEEVFMISGDLDIAGQTLRAGDYIRIERGARHGVPHTTGGCTCIVISDYVPFPLTSLLGFAGAAIKAFFGGGGRRE